jgi:hypothetical protein
MSRSKAVTLLVALASLVAAGCSTAEPRNGDPRAKQDHTFDQPDGMKGGGGSGGGGM